MRKKFGEQALSLFVALLMVVSTFPITALSATEEESKCTVCNGTGLIACSECENGQVNETCTECGGTGSVTVDCSVCNANGYLDTTCEICGGSGVDGENPCADCTGIGTVRILCENCDATGSIEVTCTECNGNKTVPEDCTICSGTGTVNCDTCSGTGKIVKEYEECPDCNGTGKCGACNGAGEIKQTCPVCSGTARIDCSDCIAGEVSTKCDICGGTGKVTVKTACTTCAGTGMVDDETCPDCNGAKEIETQETCTDCENGYVTSVCETCSGAGTVGCTNCKNGIEKTACSDCSGIGECATCSGTGKIYTSHDDSFAFTVAKPEAIQVGKTYQNTASSKNNTSGKVSYSVDDTSIASVDEQNGTVTAKKTGTVAVTAKIDTNYIYSSAQASYSLTIEKGNPEVSVTATDITYGQTLADSTLTASAVLNGQEVSGEIAWKDGSVKPSVANSNTTEYECVFTPYDTDNYNSVDCRVTLTVNKADINPTITVYEAAYDKDSHDALKISDIWDTDTVTYFVDGEEVGSMPTVKDVSDNEKTITVKIERDENYNVYEENYSCIITPIDIDAEISAKEDLVYNGEEQDALKIINNTGEELSITYKPKDLQDGELEISDGGQVKDAGTYRYEVTIVIDKNYKDKVEFPVITTVAKADAALKITNTQSAYTYEENQKILINTTKSTLTTSDVTYKVSDENVAKIDAFSGMLSVLKAGKVTVTASVAETDNCKADEAAFDITVNQADYTPEFENGESVSLTYGAQTNYINPIDATSVKGSGTISYSYSAEPADSALIENFNTETGLITFKDGVQEGTVTVIADIAADDCYKAQQVSYELKVASLEEPENSYELTNEVNNNGWINTLPIEFKAAVGYKISKSCSFSDDSWLDSITFDTTDTTDGSNEFKFYIRESSTGKITSTISNSQNVDVTAPENLTITYSNTLITKILQDITYGFYNSSKANTLSVTLKAADVAAGLEKFSYSYDGEENYIEDKPDENGEVIFSIETEYKGTISFTAYDKAGNTSSYDSKDNQDIQGAINDLTPPEGTRINYSEPSNTVDDLRYYSESPELTFSIEEENFFDDYELSRETVYTLDKNVQLEIIKDGDEYYKGSAVPDKEHSGWFTAKLDEKARIITVAIPAKINGIANDGVYAVNLTYSDLSGNEVLIKSDEFVIDKTAPIITAEYAAPIQTITDKDGNSIDYYNADNPVDLVITVEEHNFSSEYFISNIIAKNVSGSATEEINNALRKYCKDDSNWTHSGDVHIISVPLENTDANYVVNYELTDYALNKVTEANGKAVTYDTESPEIQMTIESNVVRKILNNITFGIFDKKVPASITITATDKISGIETISYSSQATAAGIGVLERVTLDVSNPFVTNKATTKNVIVSDDKEGVSYTFTVPAEFRNTLTATVQDYSYLSSSTNVVTNCYNNDDTVYDGIIADENIDNGTININVNQSAEYASENTFADNFNFYINITDKNSGIGNIVVKINGNEISKDSNGKTIESYYSGDSLIENISFSVNTSQVDLEKDTIAKNTGVYKLTVAVTDNANNTIYDEYEAYMDVYAPMITDFSFESKGNAYYGDKAYVMGEKAEAASSDTDVYSYYFEKNTYVTVYAYDYEANGINPHTAGIEKIFLIAENANGGSVDCKIVAGSFIQTSKNGVGYSEITYLIKGPFKGNLYAIASDYAGNYPTNDESCGFVADNYKELLSSKYIGFVNPYDTILEDTNQHYETSSIAIVPNDNAVSNETNNYTYNYTGDANLDKIKAYHEKKVPLYNKNVGFTLTVKDTYSGIKEISWQIIGQNDQDSKNNQQGTVTVDDLGNLGNDNGGWSKVKTDSNLVTSMKKTITVKNNSNDIVILVELTDRAGNKSYDYYVLGIDKTKPNVKVTLSGTASNNEYFNTSRTITIVVTERNFDSSKFDLTLTKNNEDISKNGSKLTWTDSQSDRNATDATTHTATLTISKKSEGDYKLSAKASDRVGNENQKVNYIGDAPTSFIIDSTRPTVKVSMTGTSKNQKYFFNEDRVVTIVVTDRNFDEKAVSLKITKDGSHISQSLKWTQDQSGSNRNNKTTNTATFTISAEGDYTFDFSCNDSGENTSAKTSYTTGDCQQFTIDKTAPVVVITQMVYQSANNGKDESGKKISIPMTVTVNDINIGNVYNSDTVTFSEITEVLNVSQLNTFSVDKSFKLKSSSRNSVIYTTSNLKNDGIYTLNLNIQDCAGNKMTAVTYNSSKNKTSTQSVSNGSSSFFTFSVNRNGSTYAIDNNTKKLVETYYVQNVVNDVVIVETNVDKLTGKNLKANVRITKDGELVDGSAFITVENTSTSSSWQRYIYTIDKSFFETEAKYTIRIESEDNANNTGYSDLTMNDDAKLTFVVDRTAPVVIISGVTSGESYYKASQHVKVTVSDDVLLTKITIIVNDNTELELEAKDFGDYFADGQFVWEYDFAESKEEQKIYVLCYDAAGNTNVDEVESPNGTIVENFLVTTNRAAIARFWIVNNVIWFVLICIAVVAVVAIAIWFIAFKRKKDSDREE